MIYRSFNKEALQETLSPYLHELVGFDLEEWGEGSSNIMLTDNDKDFAFFEVSENGIYSGHIFAREKRGKELLSFCNSCLSLIFTEFNAKAIKALPCVDNKPANFVLRRLGFTSYGVIHSIAGGLHLFILTNEEWRQLNG